jgi:Zn-dependent membrane protease YugP
MLYIIYILPGLILSIIASIWIQISYKRFSKRNTNNPTAYEIAKRVTYDENLPVDIIAQGKPLSDHFDPTNDTVKLSQIASESNSIADIAVTMHEIGHVQQKFTNSILFKIRTAIVPVVNIGSKLGYLLIIIGLFLNILQLSEFGLILFASTTIFALITVPIEIDASIRAFKLIKKYKLLSSEDMKPAKSVLSGAALTYVAALLTSFLNLLYYSSMIRRRS